MRLRLLCFLLLFALLPALADTGLARHKKIYAVPAPGTVKIDGKFDDWDLSAQIYMYVVSETADMQSARFAMMYDKDALYVGAVVRDRTPMMNRHDPAVDPMWAWDGDSCQFRLTLDPAMGYPINIGWGNGAMENMNVVHLTLWQYTDKQQPCLQVSGSMKYQPIRAAWKDGVVPADAFQAKYLKMDDGGGYTFEYRLPWSTLGAKAPLHGGDLVAGTVQFNWSNADGLHTGGGSAWCYDVMNGPGFPYQSTACWGKIIFSDKGHLPKSMVEEGVLPEKPLPLKFKYTLPEDGQITIQLHDKDNYIRRILVAQGDRVKGANTESWDGLDDQGNPLPPGDYTWKGVTHAPITQKYLFSPNNTGTPSYRTDDGTGGWGGDEGTPQDACAFPGGTLLCWSGAEAGWGVIRVDPTGKKRWGSNSCASYLATDGKRFFTAGSLGYDTSAGVKVFDVADGRPLNFGNGKPEIFAPAGGDAKTNGISGLASDGGTLYVSYVYRNLIGLFDAATGDLKGTWTVPAPGRLAACPDGTLAVVSGNSVLRVKDGKVATTLDTFLDAPQGIAADAAGTLYVSNAGALQNVSVFAPDGTYQRAIGKAGGRPRKGAYDRNGMLEPRGLAVDANGHLWVTETLDGPLRVSLWNAADGALVNEFFGGCAYSGWATMDPKHPDEIFCHDSVWKADWAKNTCTPVSTMWRATTENMVNGATDYHVFTAKNGHQYAWGVIDYSRMLFEREGDVFKPIAGTIRVAFGPYGSGVIYPVMKGIYDRTQAGAFFWQDKNNDQTIQEDELSISPAGRGEITFNWVDDELNVWCDAGYIIHPTHIEADGRPVYDFTKLEPIPWHGGNANAGSLWLDTQSTNVYTLAPDQHPGLACWTRDGKMVWGVPTVQGWQNALGLSMVTAGKLHGLTMPLDVAGDFTGSASYFGPYHIFTRDGIYVAKLMRDGRDGKGMGADITASEVFTGQLIKPDGMNRYFLLAGAADARVTEISGLDTVKRLPGGTLTLSADDAKKAADALADYKALLARGKTLSIARTRTALDTADPASKALDNGRNFTTRLAYDEKNLYVRYDVNAPAELTNSIADPRLLFKGGNCLDIQLAADPTADAKRTTPAPGDLRILVTRQGDKPIAMIYRPKVAGFKGDPIVLKSPTGTESFAAIEPSDRIALAYTKTPTGFTAVVTIPLEVLGLTPKPAQQMRLDLGYLYGNATGNASASRSYWINNSFAANVTNDIPNESRLEPKEWGTAVFE